MLRKDKRVIRQPALDNSIHAELFYYIVNGKNYAQRLSELTGKTPPLIMRQLRELAKTGLIKPQKEKRYNKVIYALNWIEIVRQLIDVRNTLLQERIKVAGSLIKHVHVSEFNPKIIVSDTYSRSFEVAALILTFIEVYSANTKIKGGNLPILTIRELFKLFVDAISSIKITGDLSHLIEPFITDMKVLRRNYFGYAVMSLALNLWTKSILKSNKFPQKNYQIFDDV